MYQFVLKNKVLEEVISLVLDIDNDGSFTIQNKEIDRLIIGMNLIDEIKFDARTFRQDLAACGGVVDEVIVLIKRMVHGDESGDAGRDTTCQIEVAAQINSCGSQSFRIRFLKIWHISPKA